MRSSTILALAVLALCAGAASASRELLGHIPKVDLPPITAFLPPLESVDMMSLAQFLNKTGLPQLKELGLPPIQELLKPVGGARNFGKRAHSKEEILAMANATMIKVITEMLPPELKAFAGVQLPKIKMGGVIPQIKLPPLPANLPPLADILRALPPIDAAGLNAALPGLSLLNLPPPAEIVKALHTVGGLLATLPKPEGLPSLDEIIRIVNSFSGTVNKVVSAPGTEQPVIG